VLRFDHRGLGDSDGTFAGFEAIGDDIRAAIDCLMAELPSLRRIALWGLCDAASAIAFYAADDPRVSEIIVVNPWVRTGSGLASVHLRHYYWRRLRSGDVWRRALAGRVDVRGAAATVAVVAGAVGRQFLGRRRRPVITTDDAGPPLPATVASLPARVAAGLQRFRGRVLVVLSTADLTAREFEDSVLRSRPMRGWRRRPQVTIRHLVGANHTCSTTAWRRQLHEWVVAWLDAGGAA
jgi:exosortase A-associated hydrolase 1